MESYLDIKELTDQLRVIARNDNFSIEKKLRDITDYVITHYDLCFNGEIVGLVELEAYYRGLNYDDTATHGDVTQKNRCGCLYEHRNGGTRKAFDIVLSDGDYYLSCLVRGISYMGETICLPNKSYKICSELCGKINLSDSSIVRVLQKKNSITPIEYVLHSTRYGVTSNEDAILRSLNTSYLYDYSQSSVHNILREYSGKAKLQYLVAELRMATDFSEDKKENLSQRLVGYKAKEVLNHFVEV